MNTPTREAERADFVLALQAEIEKLGAFAENEGTARGALPRGLMAARLAIEGRDDRIVIEELARGEEAALKVYNQALAEAQRDASRAEVSQLLIEQQDAIRAGLDDARRWLVTKH